MRILIIGGGAVSIANHIPAAIKLLGVENVILAEPSQTQIQKVVDRFGIKHVVDDYHQVLDGVDCAIVATPPHIHNQILKDLMAAGLPVLCEKPLSDHSAATHDIIGESSLVMGVCHSYRLFPNRRYVKKLIGEKFFGNHYTISIAEGGPANWPTVSGYCFQKSVVPGGVLFDAGVHSLDFIMWCAGLPDSIEYTDDACGGLESNASIVYKNQTVDATFIISRTIEMSNTIKIEGNGHVATMDVFDMENLILDGAPMHITEFGEVNWGNWGTLMLKNFLDAINEQSPLCCPISEALDVVRIIETCYAQKKEDAYEAKPFADYAGKKVLVTGGTGFIGRLLVERLVRDEKASVVVPVHTWAHAAYISRFDVDMQQVDMSDAEAVDKLVEGCDYIFHCMIAFTGSKEETIQANLTIMDNLMKAAARHKVKRVVCLSSVVVHGKTITDGMTADAPMVSYGDTYADMKMATEKAFWQLSKELNVPGSVIRPTYVWGPYSMWYTIDIVRQLKSGEFLWVDNGEGSCNAVYVHNLIDLMLACGNNANAVGQAFIAADGEKLTWHDFYSHYITHLGLRAESFKSVPSHDSFVRKVAIRWKRHLEKRIVSMKQKANALKTSHPIAAKFGILAPRRILKMTLAVLDRNVLEMAESTMAIYNYKGYINISKNETLLNLKPRFTVADGMTETIEWLKEGR